MLTIVTTPRPLCSGKFEMDFDNAVGSWLRLEPRPQILVFGGDESIVDRDGVTYIPRFPRNEQGLPYLDGCLRITQEMAEHDLVMLTSDHLILRSDFTKALKRLDERFPGPFAATGQRWDRQIDQSIDLDDPGWEEKILRGQVRPKGAAAKDWFLFRTPLPFEVENFVLGRRRWDTWFLHQLCLSGMPVVDVSCVVAPVHPVHGYGHVPLGHVADEGRTSDPGTLHNMAIEAYTPQPCNIGRLTWGLTCDRLLSGEDWERWKGDHEQAWRVKRIKPDQWGALRYPAYCWDPPVDVGWQEPRNRHAGFIGQVFAEHAGEELRRYASKEPAGFGASGNRARLRMAVEYCVRHWPGDIVEIGLGHGNTTKIFAEIACMHGRRVVAVDPFDVLGTGWGDDYFEVFLKNTEPWRDIIDLIEASSLDPDTIRAVGKRALCFAYVDGLHTYGACLSDIMSVKHCRGIIAVDDIHLEAKYAAAVLRAFRDGAVALERLPMDNSMAREGYLIL